MKNLHFAILAALVLVLSPGWHAQAQLEHVRTAPVNTNMLKLRLSMPPRIGRAGADLNDRGQEYAGQPDWIGVMSPSGARAVAPGFALRRFFEVSERPATGQLTAVFDHCSGKIRLNDQTVAHIEPFSAPARVDISDLLNVGTNHIEFVVSRTQGLATIAGRLEWVCADGSSDAVVTDDDWTATRNSDDAELTCRSLGAVWEPIFDPERAGIEIGVADDYTQWKRAIGSGVGTEPATFSVPDGFVVRMIHSARPDEDSWVAMTEDEQGRWIVAREKKGGLLRITWDLEGEAQQQVEVINENLAECRGLLFVDGDLFAMANNDKAIYRLRDTNGDDQFDEVTQLFQFAGDVGHGRNQLVRGPDGMIYGVFGDAVFEPEDCESRVPGMARPNDMEQTRSGFIARTDASGTNWEIVVRGLRNPYGLAFNGDGEMFTYDADAEYDMGSSWYRPTRVLHLVPGGDYRWRRVTRRWPPYFPDQADMPPVMLDIGKGSPTSVVAGREGRFPWPYNEAIFVLDWAYGRILAIHLQPHGASYRASAETFLRGRPLNVTDVEFGRDGAMYFITGGRGTQSALYRVDFTGDRVAKPAPRLLDHWRAQESAESRARLHAWQESFQGDRDGSIRAVVDSLADEDPAIRHAARTSLEWLPVDQWRDHALDIDIRAEGGIDVALALWIALQRVGTPEDEPKILERLAELSGKELTWRQWREYLFIAERCFEREVSDHSPLVDQITTEVLESYPSGLADLDLRMSWFLSRFSDSPRFVQLTMTSLKSAKTQEKKLHYLFVMRDRVNGMSPEQRDQYFDEMIRARDFLAGEGMPTFQRQIREEALATLDATVRQKYSDLFAESRPSIAHADLDESRPVVREWKLDDFDEKIATFLDRRDLENGKRMFQVAKCAACHRLGNEGGVLGPDLTSVSSRFSVRDMLVSMIDPSRVVADKYRSDTFVLDTGQVFTGRVVLGDYRSDQVQLMTDLLDPDSIVKFSKQSIESHEPSTVSAMPAGLLDTLTRDEVLDLLAYLRDGQIGLAVENN